MKEVRAQRWMALLLICFVPSAFGQQMTGPPFVEKVVMAVIDPEDAEQGLGNIAGFSSLAQGANGSVFALLRADAGRLGILVLDGKTLAVQEVLWPEGIGETGWQWSGIVSMGQRGVVALCCEQTSADNAQKVNGRVVTITPGRRRVVKYKSIHLPEPASAIEFISDANALVGLTKPSNTFFVLNMETDDLRLKRVLFDFVPHEYPYGKVLGRASDGRIYGSFKGRLFAYQHDQANFEYLGHLPCEFGHLSETSLTAVATNGANTLVGGIRGDGYLFTLDLPSRRVMSRGKPTDGTEIRTLVYAGETGFWGIAQTPGLPGRLFRFQPKVGSLEDLGIPMGLLRKDGRTWNWHAFQISDMLTLADGRILLAEDARQAKLLVFDPNRLANQ